jgi:hypothetical protein
MPILEKYLQSHYKKIEFISEEGFFTIKNENIYEICKENEMNIQSVPYYLNKYDAVIDCSDDIYVKKYSLPYEYIELNNEIFTFVLNNNDNIKLVFIGKYKENQFTTFFKNKSNKYDTLEIVDFYFETNNKNSNVEYLKNKINEFLLLLN